MLKPDLKDRGPNSKYLYFEFADCGYITPCWLWRGSRTKAGYGLVRFEGKSQYVHIIMYKFYKGQYGPNLELDHKCEMHACGNPEHLDPVTHRVNSLRGSRGNATINMETAVEMRKMSILGITGREIANHFNVHECTVSDVLRGVSWIKETQEVRS
jgi:hypothetical protein